MWGLRQGWPAWEHAAVGQVAREGSVEDEVASKALEERSGTCASKGLCQDLAQHREQEGPGLATARGKWQKNREGIVGCLWPAASPPPPETTCAIGPLLHITLPGPPLRAAAGSPPVRGSEGPTRPRLLCGPSPVPLAFEVRPSASIFLVRIFPFTCFVHPAASYRFEAALVRSSCSGLLSLSPVGPYGGDGERGRPITASLWPPLPVCLCGRAPRP